MGDTNLTTDELELLADLRTRSDWPGMRHDCLMCQRSYAFLMQSTRRERLIGVTWELQFESILDYSGFVFGE